ncbi:MAG: metal-dependent hydrolase [Planctomycetota bacterium]|jgi:inner membrane protein
MASVITHAVTGLAAGKIVTGKEMPGRFWALSVICPLLPDIDGIGFMMGVPYGSFFGHRGFFHSPFFALLLGLAATAVFFDGVFSRKWWLLALYFSLITATHGVLDAMTDGGHGIAFLSPFTNARFFLPWRPLVVAPIGILEFFSGWGLTVMLYEMIYILIPAFFLLVISILIRAIIFRVGKPEPTEEKRNEAT